MSLLRLCTIAIKPCRSWAPRYLSSTGGTQDKKPKTKVVKNNNTSKKAKSIKEPHSPLATSDPGPPPIQTSFPPNQAAGNEYKAKDLFDYNIDSYADLFVDMSKYRLLRPSNKS